MREILRQCSHFGPFSELSNRMFGEILPATLKPPLAAGTGVTVSHIESKPAIFPQFFLIKGAKLPTNASPATRQSTSSEPGTADLERGPTRTSATLYDPFLASYEETSVHIRPASTNGRMSYWVPGAP